MTEKHGGRNKYRFHLSPIPGKQSDTGEGQSGGGKEEDGGVHERRENEI